MRARSTLAGTLALAGGVAAGIGSFLTWVEFSAGPVSEQARGIDGWEGKATLVAGVVMAVAGMRALTGGLDALVSLRTRAAIGGLAAAGVGLYTALTAKEQLLDAAGTQLPRAQIERALDTGLLELSIAVGLFVVIAGGIQGVLAALLTIGVREAGPAAPSSGLRGWAAIPPSPPGAPTITAQGTAGPGPSNAGTGPRPDPLPPAPDRPA